MSSEQEQQAQKEMVPSKNFLDVSTATTVASDDGPHEQQNFAKSGGQRYCRLVVLALVVVAVGLAVGLGLGLTMNEQESQNLRVPTTSAPEETTNNATPYVSLSSTTSEDEAPVDVEEVVDEEEPVEEEEPQEDTPEEESSPATEKPESQTSVPIEQLTEWPGLVGMPCEDAKAKLEEMYQGMYTVVIVHPGDETHKDLRFDRVKVYVDDNCEVTEVPYIGR